jgi:predicted Rossmann fold flavoprotein
MKVYDVCVVGAGAAGLMSAIMASRNGLNVLLLDSQKKIGAKILMSGGTRCNVTNDVVELSDYNSETPHIVRNILKSFTPPKTIKFFNELGVKFVLEPGGKYFPTTHSGKTILDSFFKALEKEEVTLHNEFKVKQILFSKGIFEVKEETYAFYARTVIIATGGLSHPGTGSEGMGYKLAKSFGHTIIPTVPALTPLVCEDSDWKSLSGISVESSLSLLENNKKIVEFKGPLLFTHFGFSGPTALNISRNWMRIKSQENVSIVANFYPQGTRENLVSEIQKFTVEHPKKNIKSFLTEAYPERFSEIILKKTQIDAQTNMSQLKKEDRLALIDILTHCVLDIKDVYGYGKAEVTAGGIDLKEVDSKTLESLKQKGLYFVGEILDVDGRIGGFNFQWAWASGYVVAHAIASKYKK